MEDVPWRPLGVGGVEHLIASAGVFEPMASRPSKIMMARKPLCLTHSCNLHNSDCSLRNFFTYFFPFIFPLPFGIETFCAASFGEDFRNGRLTFLLKSIEALFCIIFYFVD